MTTRPVDRLLKVIGWLLTPLVVWAASFLGGWVGAAIGQRVGTLGGGIGWMIGGALLAGVGAFILWVGVVRKRAIRRLARLKAAMTESHEDDES